MNNNIPEFLINMLKDEYESLENNIIESYNIKRYTTIRTNTLLSCDEEIIKYLDDNNIEYEKGIIKNSFIIKNKSAKDLYGLDIVENGKIYIQSLSSMLPPYFLEPKEKEDILDMAAAPGGKTTLLAQITNNKARICAVEKDKYRFERLKYNVLKQNANSVYVINNDSLKLDDYMKFDKILLDAPCSGSGTINTNNNAKIKISKELIKNSSILQMKLLDKALKLLKNDSYMIYSTCSILSIENEDVLNKILPKYNAKIIPIDLNIDNKLPSKIDGVLKVMPNEYYEGFFIAKIYKP